MGRRYSYRCYNAIFRASQLGNLARNPKTVRGAHRLNACDTEASNCTYLSIIG